MPADLVHRGSPQSYLPGLIGRFQPLGTVTTTMILASSGLLDGGIEAGLTLPNSSSTYERVVLPNYVIGILSRQMPRCPISSPPFGAHSLAKCIAGKWGECSSQFIAQYSIFAFTSLPRPCPTLT
jgi:hypothetical protein